MLDEDAFEQSFDTLHLLEKENLPIDWLSTFLFMKMFGVRQTETVNGAEVVLEFSCGATIDWEKLLRNLFRNE